MRHGADMLDVVRAMRLPRAFSVIPLLLLTLALTGCLSSDSGDIGGAALGSLPAVAVQGPVGLPPDKTQTLGNAVADALQSRRVTLARTSESPARFKMQGVCSASPGGGSTSVACVWDLLAPNGQRAQRIITEETVRGAQARSPWSAVNNATLNRIAASVAEKTAAWLPQAPAPQTSGFSLSRLTGGSRSRTVSVTGVTGASGSGNSELANALRDALRSRNLVVTTSGTSAYRVSAAVKVSRAGNEDAVAIDWQVTDSGGATLGTITQRNRVARGALNRGWGTVAVGAAEAASKGIVQLIP